MTARSAVYPVLLTPNPDGTMTFFVPDFPEILMENVEFTSGIQLVKDKICDEVLLSMNPPYPTPTENIMLAPGQMILNISADE